ncbi:MAG TPA: hypothetical protein VLD67_20280 [Vicinamibacterales bacterium]|nr:hypothetical protein [Vicinamibacterales bacterium]
MGLLTDLLLELVDLGEGPSGDRGLVGTLTAASIACASLMLWLLLKYPDPLDHSWGLGAYVRSLAAGGSGSLISLLHLSRNRSDLAFSIVCLTANVAAVAIGVIGVVVR